MPRGRMHRVSTDLDPPGTRRHFGDFELDIANARLRQAGTEVELTPKSFALLAYLAQRPGELVLKDTLLDTVWGRRFVSEGAVKTVVSDLRAALGDDARAPRWIETVQRRGYRFLGDVRVGAAGDGRPAATASSVESTQAGLADAGAAPPRGNLPPSLPPLVAREDELARVHALLAAGRLVTICGPAGVGKTSLALAAATQRQAMHAGGAWLAELAPLPADATTAPELRAALARALQVPPSGIDDDAALVRALQGQPLLLVLDNAEHLVDALAPLVAQLQRQLPLLHWLVTSREPLHVPDEQVLRLAPLSLPPLDDAPDAAEPGKDGGAMQLFIQRVAARLPGFAPVGAQRLALMQLCRALDGLPLALELAAARVPLLGVQGLADHLLGDEAIGGTGGGRRLKLLTQSPRTAQPHQRTLRAALDWSHALLKPAEQRVFRRLAVFRGGFTLAAAQAVCADDAHQTDGGLDSWGVLDALDALAGKSMVVAPAHEEPGARFTLLESLREYAAEALQAAGEGQATAQRHLQWMVAHWAQADETALLEPALAWTARLAPEIENLRAALRWAHATLIAGESAGERTGLRTGERAGERADNSADISADKCAGKGAGKTSGDLLADLLALVAHSTLFWQRAGLLTEGAQWCLAMRARVQAQGEPLRRAGIYLALALLCRYTPLMPPTESLALVLQAADAYRTAGDAVREYFAHYLAWTLTMEVDENLDRTPHIQRMQALVQAGWSPLLRRYVRIAWMQDERLQGRNGAFLQGTREDLALFRQMGAQGESWSTGLGLMWAEHDQGCPERAIAVGRALVDEVRAAGRLRTYAQLFTVYITMLAESGDVAATRPLLAEAVPMMPSMSACEILLLAMGWLASHEGRDTAAAQLLGWFDAPQRGGGSYGERTFTRRCAKALGARLDERLGAAHHQALQAGAAALGDAEAVRLGLATDSAQERRQQPRTDGNPTAS